MNNFKILFLGYNADQTKLISFLKKKKFKVNQLGQKQINIKNIDKDTLLISFGYKKIIKKHFLEKLKRPPINIHISYLPYNRGSHPNYWSFIDKSPSGVSIHEINSKIDQGNIIFQKKIKFKSLKTLTFFNTYKILIKEAENLFIRHFRSLVNYNYKTKKKISNKGSFHKKSDLPIGINWNQNIYKYIKKLN